MISIISDIVNHKGKQVLLFKFPYNQGLINCFKKHTEATWSNSHRAWYLPYSVQTIQQVSELFEERATIDFSIVKGKLEQRKNLPPDIKNFTLSNESGALIRNI